MIAHLSSLVPFEVVHLTTNRFLIPSCTCRPSKAEATISKYAVNLEKPAPVSTGEHVRTPCEASLQRLGVQNLDCRLKEWGEFSKNIDRTLSEHTSMSRKIIFTLSRLGTSSNFDKRLLRSVSLIYST